jgi:hypothetical protein
MTSRAATFLVEATDDLDAVRAAVRDLATQYGAPAAVVALKEDDLLVGAQLRREWRCGGPRPHDLPVFCDMAFPPTQGEVLPLGRLSAACACSQHSIPHGHRFDISHDRRQSVILGQRRKPAVSTR